MLHIVNITDVIFIFSGSIFGVWPPWRWLTHVVVVVKDYMDTSVICASVCFYKWTSLTTVQTDSTAACLAVALAALLSGQTSQKKTTNFLALSRWNTTELCNNWMVKYECRAMMEPLTRWCYGWQKMKDYKNGTEFGCVDAINVMKTAQQNPPPKTRRTASQTFH